MEQIKLFECGSVQKGLETFIEREGNTLVIPEGIHTIPCTHGIHKFAGKFIPNLPRYLIRTVLSNDRGRVLFDPFCGSGTTLVEAALDGRPFIGLDIDPLAVMISKVKTSVLDQSQLEQIKAFWKGHNYYKLHSALVPEVPNLDHWFSERAIIELSSIKSHCLEFPPKQRDFCLVVFSSIIRRVSNADDQTQKTYVSHTLSKKSPNPSDLFPIFLDRAIKGMCEFARLLSTLPRGSICIGDAINDIDLISFDDIITSPPYIDSIDYIYNQMLEYFWLLDELGVATYNNFRAMRKCPMGFRLHDNPILVDFLADKLGGANALLSDICDQISKFSPKEASVVRSFFYDYARHVENIRSRQNKKAVYICIIADSIIRGVVVPTVDFIQSIHINSGYSLLDKVTYEIRRHYMKFPRKSNSGIIKQDYVNIFEVN